MLGATVELRKTNTILLVAIVVTIHDSGMKVFRDTDFPWLFRDPL